MTTIHFFEIGSDDDDLTIEQVKQLPTTNEIPEFAVKLEKDSPGGYYYELLKHFDIYCFNETVYLTAKQ